MSKLLKIALAAGFGFGLNAATANTVDGGGLVAIQRREGTLCTSGPFRAG